MTAYSSHAAYEALVLLAAGQAGEATADLQAHVDACPGCGLLFDFIGPLDPAQIAEVLWAQFGPPGEFEIPTLPDGPVETAPVSLPTPTPQVLVAIGQAHDRAQTLLAAGSETTTASAAGGLGPELLMMAWSGSDLVATVPRGLAGRTWAIHAHVRHLNLTRPKPIAIGRVPRDGTVRVPARKLSDAVANAWQLVWAFGSAKEG